MIIILLGLALQVQPVGYNGDDYMRPDVRERRLERQEDQRWQTQKWIRQQDERQRWLNGIQRRD